MLTYLKNNWIQKKRKEKKFFESEEYKKQVDNMLESVHKRMDEKKTRIEDVPFN